MRKLILLLSMLLMWVVPVGAAEVPDHPQVVVIGGGICGLVTAWKLEQRGYKVCVLETSDRLGGRIGTAHYGDLAAEYGMQEIWEKSPLLGITKELGLDLEGTDDAWSSLIIDNHLYPFVQDTREAYFQKLFTPAERKPFDAALKEMESIYTEATTKGLTPRVLATQNESYSDWLKARHLSRKVDMALRLTIEVELASNAESFSALSAILEYRTFLFGGEKNYHVKGGNDQIITRLAAALHGTVVLGARVTHAIRHMQDGKVVAEVLYL
ncbi:MAG TPA: FAD-dependent oxidoreductase, partial [Candidatus Xenobia bacterium]